MKAEENDILKSLKKKRDYLCSQLGVKGADVENSFLNRTEKELNTQRIADLSREIANIFADQAVPDQQVISWLEDYLKDLSEKRLQVPLAQLRLQNQLAESESFGV